MTYLDHGRDIGSRIQKYKQFIAKSDSNWVDITDYPAINLDFDVLHPKELKRQQVLGFWAFWLFCSMLGLVVSFMLLHTFAEQLVADFARPLFLVAFLLIMAFLVVDVIRESIKSPLVVTVPAAPGVYVKRAKISSIKRLIADMERFEKEQNGKKSKN